MVPCKRVVFSALQRCIFATWEVLTSVWFSSILVHTKLSEKLSMKQPYEKLPKNNLSDRQHQRAGEIAVALMNKPVQRQTDKFNNKSQNRAYST